MVDLNNFGSSVETETIRIKDHKIIRAKQQIASEVPFTIIANNIEIATLFCSPDNLKEMAYGFLYTSCFIKSLSDIHSCVIDVTRWTASVEINKTPDLSIMDKRIFTSGCGKGVMYASIGEISVRHPIITDLSITMEQVINIAKCLQKNSSLHRLTGGVHTSALSLEGNIPDVFIDDIGRHNAVDKIIGKGLIRNTDFSKTVLITSGRISSDILQKTRRCNISIIIARGAPTHQAVLRAYDMNIALIGFARGSNFTIYSHEERINLS